VSSYNYPVTDFPGVAHDGISRRIINQGYTSVVTEHRVDGDGDRIHVTVDQHVSEGTLRSDILAGDDATLTLSTLTLDIAGDGQDRRSVTVSDSRRAGANGKTVVLAMASEAASYVDRETAVLGVTGQVTFTFGPTPDPETNAGPFTVFICLSDDSSRPTSLTFQFID